MILFKGEKRMTIQEKIALLEDMLEVDEGTLTEDMKLEEIDEWNSLAYLSFSVLLSDEFNKKVPASVIKRHTSVKELLEEMN